MYNTSDSNPILNTVTFSGNFASSYGAGPTTRPNTPPTPPALDFIANGAGNGGGGRRHVIGCQVEGHHTGEGSTVVNPGP